MKLNVVTAQQPASLKVNILLQNKDDGGAIASVLEIPGCRVEAQSREQALEALQKLLVSHLQAGEIVPVEIRLSQTEQSENPWIKFAGVFKDDPDFAALAEEIRAERNAIDDPENDQL